jgi:uncharacterized protein YqeY
LTSKKNDVELSRAYASILKQIEAATIGVKNPEKDEEKLILSAAKKELKEQEQSKNLGAPFSQKTIDLCKLFVQELSPTMVSEEQTRIEILGAIEHIERFGFNPDMKKIMAFIKSDTGKNYDMKLVSSIANEILNNYKG